MGDMIRLREMWICTYVHFSTWSTRISENPISEFPIYKFRELSLSWRIKGNRYEGDCSSLKLEMEPKVIK